MAKTTWRDRLKAHGFTLWAFTWRRTMVRSRVDGEWVSARRVSVVIAKLEREIIDLTSERDEARAEVERLRGEIVRSEKAKLHLIAKVRAPRVTDDMVERATMKLLAHEKDLAPGIDWHCNRQWTVNKVRALMRSALEEVL